MSDFKSTNYFSLYVLTVTAQKKLAIALQSLMTSLYITTEQTDILDENGKKFEPHYLQINSVCQIFYLPHYSRQETIWHHMFLSSRLFEGIMSSFKNQRKNKQ